MRRKGKKMRYGVMTLFILYNLVLAAVLAPFILFYGPFDALKTIAVGSVLTSRHPQYVKAFLSDEEIEEIVHKYTGANSGSELTVGQVETDIDGITIEEVKGKGFVGKVMLVKDPKWIQLAVTAKLGTKGERVSELVKNSGGIAGTNAGGFDDPDGRGNGGYPDGITVHKGEIVHSNMGDKATDMVAFNDKGQLIVGVMTAAEVKEKNIREGISFWPALIKDGKRCEFNDGQWGIAPRTAIGQKADGTVIFVVIDGRQPTYSMGALMSDVYNIFVKYGAVTAANLDGGSSTTLVYQDKIVNKPCDIFGERYLPNAFVVVPETN